MTLFLKSLFLMVVISVSLLAQETPVDKQNLKKLLQENTKEFSQTFLLANRYYQNQEYGSALKLYQELINTLPHFYFQKIFQAEKIAILYYNLGNTYYKLAQQTQGLASQKEHESYIANAVRYYNQIFFYAKYPSARFNLNVIKKKYNLSTEIEEWSPITALIYLRGLASHISGWFILILIVLGWYLIRTTNKKTKWYRIIRHTSIIISISYVLVVFTLVLPLLVSQKPKQAIISHFIKLRSEPNLNENNKVIFELSAGEKVNTISEVKHNNQDLWVEIESQGRKGWIEKKNLFSIQPY